MSKLFEAEKFVSKHSSYSKEYHKEYNVWHYQKNKERYLQEQAEYRKDYEGNKEEIDLKHRLHAYIYANNNHLKSSSCLVCDLFRDIHKEHHIFTSPFIKKGRLEFHHTDYEKNEGATLCVNHHKELHRCIK